MSDRYREAGVDLAKATEVVEVIKKIARPSLTPWVISGIGGFSGLIGLAEIKEHLTRFEDPVLSFTVDGVGTKPKVAKAVNRLGVCGEDIVNHCINDTLPSGAVPIAFLDYIAQDSFRIEEVAQVIKGMTRACETAGIPLLGGETADMLGVYQEGEADIVGFMVGIADRKDVIDGSAIGPRDVLIGLPSNGLHTSGYSLARDIFSKEAWPGSERYWHNFHYRELGGKVWEALLLPHTSYLSPVNMLREARIKINGMAHITGGGIVENLTRILPKGARARIVKDSWPSLPIFELIQKVGEVSEEEMFEVFNMGIGMILVVAPGNFSRCMKLLHDVGQAAYRIGKIQEGPPSASLAEDGESRRARQRRRGVELV